MSEEKYTRVKISSQAVSYSNCTSLNFCPHNRLQSNKSCETCTLLITIRINMPAHLTSNLTLLIVQRCAYFR